jgi:hypothetical protein
MFLIERVSHVYLLTPGQKKSPLNKGLREFIEQRKEKRYASACVQTR